MVVCSHCGREARDDNRFCQFCGELLDSTRSNGYVAPEPAFSTSPPAAPPDSGETNEMPAINAAVVPPVAVATVSGPASQAQALSRLLVRKASSEGGEEREYILAHNDIAIGRSPSCDIVLEGDELASRRHALIRVKNGGYTVVDLGSINGTYVNGYEIREEKPLKEGDRIAVGSHEITFAVGAAGPNASVAGERLSGSYPAVAASVANGADAVDQDDSSETAEIPAVHPPVRLTSGPIVAVGAAEAGETEQPSDVAEAQIGDGDGDGTVTDMPSAAASAVARAEKETAPLSAASAEELEALSTQISNIAGVLARKADEEARIATRYREALVELRAQVERLIRRQEEDAAAPDTPAAQNTELAEIARQAAENPRHLDYLTSLATHGQEIAAALEAPAQPAGVPVDDLRELLERIADVLG